MWKQQGVKFIIVSNIDNRKVQAPANIEVNHRNTRKGVNYVQS